MENELTAKQWGEILLNKELTTNFDLSIMQAIYSFDGHKVIL